MIIAMFALIALGSILVFTGRERVEAAKTPLRDLPPAPAAEPQAQLTAYAPTHIRAAARSALSAQVATGEAPADTTEAAAQATHGANAPLRIDNLTESRAADEVLVLEYGGQPQRPALTLEHSEDPAQSKLFADGALVLEVRYGAGEAPLSLDEIVLSPR